MPARNTLPLITACNNATLRRAGRKLGQFYDQMLAPSGLKATQQSLLYQIQVGGEPAMGEVAEAMIMDLSALGHTLKPLLRDGYVETFPDKDDRRIRRVRLTDAGRQTLAHAMRLWAIAQARLEEKMGKGEAAALRTALDALARLDLDAGSAP